MMSYLYKMVNLSDKSRVSFKLKWKVQSLAIYAS